VRLLLIKLNPILLRRPQLLSETVGHELAHLIVYARHGPKCKPHGPEWRKLMQSAGLPIRTCVQMTGAIVDKGTKLSCLARRHTYRCPVCQARWVTRRTMKSWPCPFCLEAGLSGELLVE
jgi:SprT protein